jgi:IS30 family transposase
MEKKYKMLTYTDRLKMEGMINSGKNSQSDVARYLSVNRSTISREYKRGQYVHRNSDYTEAVRYSADLAQLKINAGNINKGKMLKIGNDWELVRYLEQKIKKEKYSPEAALASIEREGLLFATEISLRTLYRYIKEGLFPNLTVEDLPLARKKRKHKARKKGKRAPVGKSIEKRPKNINTREEFGHWEMDTVKGKQGHTKGCLLVLTERKTKKEIVKKMSDQQAHSVVEELNKLEAKWGNLFKTVFKTITVDNGVEFSDNNGMEMSCLSEEKRTDLYYCHPYSSYERGSNENQNRLVRRHIPKGVDFDDKTSGEIQYIEDWINDYPRRSFNYYTANEMFEMELNKLGIVNLF